MNTIKSQLCLFVMVIITCVACGSSPTIIRCPPYRDLESDYASIEAALAKIPTKTGVQLTNLQDSKSRDESTDQDVDPIGNHLIAD